MIQTTLLVLGGWVALSAVATLVFVIGVSIGRREGFEAGFEAGQEAADRNQTIVSQPRRSNSS